MISREEIANLAELARLKLTEEEAVGLQKDISSILDYVGQVSSVSMNGQKETPVVRNVLREDAVRAENDPLAGKEEVVRAAFPRQEGGYNVVRKIIQKDE